MFLKCIIQHPQNRYLNNIQTVVSRNTAEYLVQAWDIPSTCVILANIVQQCSLFFALQWGAVVMAVMLWLKRYITWHDPSIHTTGFVTLLDQSCSMHQV
jgi:hypothetical protein